MLLLLDENASDRRFVHGLREAGHDIETSVALLGVGASDTAIVDHALVTRRAVVTRDCADFRSLYAELTQHHGLLLIYSGKATTTQALLRAIDRISELYDKLDNLIMSLNDFFW